eukprot:CAMPEP_0184746932 /NCGR_PEP_ID=MMETSP0315-20130426/9396_1 /TAXON_ID=101924 /ORGANISM="Rhodosorus marinus, Strain UTEX LB 2760" /LENGTH=366 /DNA_ID=CAMNT_0027219683 /DNA_START=46 /DNA_END=1146 /DNA_ORIENTATION=+
MSSCFVSGGWKLGSGDGGGRLVCARARRSRGAGVSRQCVDGKASVLSTSIGLPGALTDERNKTSRIREPVFEILPKKTREETYVGDIEDLAQFDGDGDGLEPVRKSKPGETGESEPFNRLGASSGGPELSKDDFLASHYGLVVSIAKKHGGSAVSLEDLIQQGMVGLCKAYEMFDSERGVKFSSYATHWIRYEVQSARRNERLIRHPKHVHDFDDKIRRAVQQSVTKRGRIPRLEELAKDIGIPKTKVSEKLSHRRSCICLAKGNELADKKRSWACPERRLMRDTLKENVDQGLREALSNREQLVIRKKFALDCAEPPGLGDLARQLSVSSGRVSQIEKAALNKMRKHYLQQGETHLDLLYLSSNF